jgi:TnpA family transposase
MIDVIFSQDGGQRPDIIVADTGTYSDLVFGLTQLLGIEYRPELAHARPALMADRPRRGLRAVEHRGARPDRS